MFKDYNEKDFSKLINKELKSKMKMYEVYEAEYKADFVLKMIKLKDYTFEKRVSLEELLDLIHIDGWIRKNKKREYCKITLFLKCKIKIINTK